MTKEESHNIIGIPMMKMFTTVLILIYIPMFFIFNLLGEGFFILFSMIYLIIIMEYFSKYAYHEYQKTIKYFAGRVQGTYTIFGCIFNKFEPLNGDEEIKKAVDHLFTMIFDGKYISYRVIKVSTRMLTEEEVKSLIFDEVVEITRKNKKRLKLINKILRRDVK